MLVTTKELSGMIDGRSFSKKEEKALPFCVSLYSSQNGFIVPSLSDTGSLKNFVEEEERGEVFGNAGRDILGRVRRDGREDQIT